MCSLGWGYFDWYVVKSVNDGKCIGCFLHIVFFELKKPFSKKKKKSAFLLRFLYLIFE